ncbi:MAG: hypothetical protein ACTSPM_03755 [Candidatus Heimdallarchaeota archaeon]
MITMSSEVLLDKFGEFLVSNLRDSAIDFFDKLLVGYWKPTALQTIQKDLKEFSSEQRETIRKSFVAGIDTAIHDFLFALEENYETTKDIEISVEGTNIVTLSEGLHSELLNDEGWFLKFSRYIIEF